MRQVLPFVAGSLLVAALASAQNKPNLAAPRLAAPKPFQVVEATIPEMRSAMEQGQLDLPRTGDAVPGPDRHV